LQTGGEQLDVSSGLSMIRVAARDRWRGEIVSSSRRTQRSGIGRETGGRENAQDDENDPALPLSSLHPLPSPLRRAEQLGLDQLTENVTQGGVDLLNPGCR
jgi:hypothetical protein